MSSDLNKELHNARKQIMELKMKNRKLIGESLKAKAFARKQQTAHQEEIEHWKNKYNEQVMRGQQSSYLEESKSLEKVHQTNLRNHNATLKKYNILLDSYHNLRKANNDTIFNLRVDALKAENRWLKENMYTNKMALKLRDTFTEKRSMENQYQQKVMDFSERARRTAYVIENHQDDPAAVRFLQDRRDMSRLLIDKDYYKSLSEMFEDSLIAMKEQNDKISASENSEEPTLSSKIKNQLEREEKHFSTHPIFSKNQDEENAEEIKESVSSCNEEVISQNQDVALENGSSSLENQTLPTEEFSQK